MIKKRIPHKNSAYFVTDIKPFEQYFEIIGKKGDVIEGMLLYSYPEIMLYQIIRTELRNLPRNTLD